LAVLDCGMLAMLVAAVLALRRIHPPAALDVQGAFQDLDRSIARFVPDMPAGFTWGEAFQRLKGAGVKVDWQKMESSLAEYEAFRYGGHEMPKGGEDEVVRLSTKIRRRIVGYGD
jgi:hypothetical protein